MRKPDHTPGSSAATATLPRTVLLGVRRRDPEALAAFFEHCFDGVYGLALRMLGRRSLAEDVVQEVFLRVHKAAATIDPDRDPMPWLRTITANLCRDHWRSFGARVERGAVPLADHHDTAAHKDVRPADPESEYLAGEKEEHVQAALMRLPEQLREVVVLRDYEGLDHGTIGEMLGATSAAVRKRYSRALARLGELLQGEWP